MPGYKTKIESIRLGPYHYRIRSLQDLQQYADPEGIARDAGIHCATWSLFGNLWPSSIILAESLLDHPVEGKRILETGCGLALASLVLHSRGAHIVASDYHPLAADFLEENLRINGLPPLPFVQADWSAETSDLGLFDLIVGSDLLYEPNQPELLAGFISRHAQAHSQVIIVDPGRKQDGKFSRLMAELGFSLEVERPRTPEAQELGFKGKRLRYIR